MIMLVNRAGAEWRLPPTILFKRVPYAVHVPYLAVAGTDGAVRTGRDVVQPRQFALEGRIYYPGDKARIRRELEDLLQFLMQPPIEVHRSEEHTSELQSRGHLVCRLLLEKK